MARRRWWSSKRLADERGFAMAALLVLMTIMAIAMTTALPTWHTMAQREKEEELIFRGKQYAHAIALFQRKYAGAFPPDVDVLVREKFLRKKYKDPITGDDFQVVGPGDAAAAALAAPAAGSATPGGRAATPTGAASAAPGIVSNMPGRASASAPQSGIGGIASQTGRAGAPGTTAGASAGVMGVRSKSTAKAFRLYNGHDHYNEWIFLGTEASQAAGAPGTPAPGGGRGGRGAPQPGRGTPTPFGAPGGRFGAGR